MSWTEEELDILYSEYPEHGSDIPAINRSREAIRKKAHREDLKYDHRTEVKCYTCGATFEIRDSRVEKAERHFCDMECKGEWDEVRFSGSNHPKYGTELDESVRNKISESLSGESNPMWEGGGHLNYNASWPEKREERLKKDNHRCQHCGLTREEHFEKYDVDLSVHHIVPLRTFDDGDKANRISNLVTLCMACHRKVESGNIQVDN